MVFISHKNICKYTDKLAADLASSACWTVPAPPAEPWPENPGTVNSSIRYASSAWPLATNRTTPAPPVVNHTQSLKTTVHKVWLINHSRP